ncbi:MAG: tripartite tricarboxylate transporter substrate binding protein [Burkholderiales bacterium]|nr:tripartite tricarboxylate transporter substrate binding protein [Burkholderiales bacterium]
MDNPRSRQRRATLAALCALPWLSLRAAAQVPGYPAKPIRFIVPFSTGGGPDLSARRIADALGPRLGTSMVVENRVGATGMIGLAELARSPADGHVIALVNLANTIAQSMQAKPLADTVRDLAPVTLVGRQYTILCVAPNSPARDVAGLTRLLKDAPGQHTFASGGNGTPAHLAGELYRRAVGVDARHIPYKALPTALTDVGRGEISFIFSIGNSAIPLVRNGRLRALAIAAPQRVAALPDLPTLAEAGVPGVDVQSWTGIVAPAATPRAIVDTLNRALRDVMTQPEMRTAFENLGIEVVHNSPDEFGALLKSELQRWTAFVRQAGITQD